MTPLALVLREALGGPPPVPVPTLRPLQPSDLSAGAGSAASAGGGGSGGASGPGETGPGALAPFAAAALGGLRADRVGVAFARGYQAALRRLVPALVPGCTAAFCATEGASAHPRAIASTLRAAGGAFELRGEKNFVTFGREAERLLVVARRADEADLEGRPRIVVVNVAGAAPGVTFEDVPDLPFVPEVPHSRVRFEGVRVEADGVLPGDGYADYVKPFRTLEDVFVHAALLGYLLGLGRRARFGRGPLERLAAALAELSAFEGLSPSAPEVHVALAGALDRARALVAEVDAEWGRAPDLAADLVAERARWERDKPLLGIAGRAREARRASAWERLGAAGEG